MNDEQGKQFAGLYPAPDDYEFSPEKSELWIIQSASGGNKVISQVIQHDDKAFRFLWSRAQEQTAEIEKQQKSELQKALDWQLAKIRETGIEGNETNLSRIGVFFSVLGVLIDKRAFPKKTTVDVFIKSAISFLYGNEDLFKWLAKWHYLATGKREPDKADLVKVSHKLEKTKVYIYQTGKQLSLFFDDEEKQNAIIAKGVDIIGMELDVIEDNCLFAIQTLLSDNNYKPTWTDEKTGNNGFAFTVPAFLDACGVPWKINRHNKKEYDINGRRAHLAGLDRLSKKFHILIYETERDEKGNRYRAKQFKPLWTFHQLCKVTKTGREYIERLAITDYNDTLGLDIVNYFLLMPREIKAQIRELTGRRHTRGHDRFISNIFTAANEKRRLESKGKTPEWKIEFNHSTIFKRYEFQNMAQKRNYSLIWKQWKSYCELALSLGYIKKFETVNGKRQKKEVIELNREKFCEIWRDLDLKV